MSKHGGGLGRQIIDLVDMSIDLFSEMSEDERRERVSRREKQEAKNLRVHEVSFHKGLRNWGRPDMMVTVKEGEVRKIEWRGKRFKLEGKKKSVKVTCWMTFGPESEKIRSDEDHNFFAVGTVSVS